MKRPLCLQRWLHAATALLALSGVAFVALKIKEHAGQIDISGFSADTWSLLIVLALVYGGANVLLARAWWNLLKQHKLQVPWQWALKTYGVSQINKYIPGNIFHLAGRQAIGMAAGLGAQPLARCSLWELMLIAAIGGVFGILAAPLQWHQVSLGMAIGLWALAMTVSIALLRNLGAHSLSRALGWQAGFLWISSVVFMVVLKLMAPADALQSPEWPILWGAYILAWLAGLLSPGAPAGVGVREAVLLLLLSGHFAQADLLLAVVVGRVITASGDLLFYLYALTLRAQHAVIND
ncbi:hypothetical protein B0E41_18495 [Hydrogenophaga sp. A37]|nr:hypothetical protein B0E41_18495 [Hydrogenophaga sp. A37]